MGGRGRAAATEPGLGGASDRLLGMTRELPRRVVGDAKAWKAMSHPLRKEILQQLGHGPANSTVIAEALGQNTGTTSYHLRVLAAAGLIEEVPGRAKGRERWWRSVAIDRREPDYDSLDDRERRALDAWRAGQIPGEIRLFQRMLDEFRQHGSWAKAFRASGYVTLDGLEALFEGYGALLREHVHTAEDAPPGARPMQLRMFYLPDEDDAGPADR
jgi:DNA-binding transcriptional ArsR family regulator